MDYRLRRVDAAEARALVEDLVALYEQVFAEPPYDEGPEDWDRFRALLNDELGIPEFAMAGAWHTQELVGMCYGFRDPAAAWWGETAVPIPPPVFAVMELGVHSGHRGKGVGQRLLELLLEPRPEATAVLKVWTAAPARQTYLGWGWTVHGTYEASNRPPVEIMSRPVRISPGAN